MKVELIEMDKVKVSEINIARCFRHGAGTYMIVRNQWVDVGNRVSAVNLVSGEVCVLDERIEVVPVNLKAVEETK